MNFARRIHRREELATDGAGAIIDSLKRVNSQIGQPRYSDAFTTDGVYFDPL